MKTTRTIKTQIQVWALVLIVSFAMPAWGQKPELKLYGKVDELASQCANAGVSLSGTKFPFFVQKVRLGSPAYYAGVRDQDTVLNGRIENNRMFLVLQRKGKTYSVNLAVQAHSLNLQDSKQSSLQPELAENNSPKQVNAKASENDIELFKEYNVVLLIDRSGSMDEPLSSVPESKWDWCREQISSFSTEAGSALPEGLTIVLFNEQYTILKNCRASAVLQCFQDNRPDGNTDLSTPLEDILTQQVGTSSKKLLVVVITDGLPNRGRPAVEVIKEAVGKMHNPSEIIISFLEIGEEFQGRAFLGHLDNGLVLDGAKYDIVRTLTFDQLSSLGLTKALIGIIKESAPAKTSTSSPGSN